MKYFIITIYGTPTDEVAKKLWDDIAHFNVNLMILDNRSFIFGEAFDNVIDIIAAKAEHLGLEIETERRKLK